jgi:hypothetical protein
MDADDQDLEDGGIGDRPGDWVDVFHTIFGVAGTSIPHTYFDILQRRRISEGADWTLADRQVSRWSGIRGWKMSIRYIVCRLSLYGTRGWIGLMRHYQDSGVGQRRHKFIEQRPS